MHPHKASSTPDPASKEKFMECLQKHNKLSKGALSDGGDQRVTRRMLKILSQQSHSQDKNSEQCAICLNKYSQDYGLLTCGHSFCRICLVKWWRQHSTCPFCREQILFIKLKNSELVYFCDLEPEEEEEDKPFIPHCEFCYGEIEPEQAFKICGCCRAVYWHSNCLPSRANSWECEECSHHQQSHPH